MSAAACSRRAAGVAPTWRRAPCGTRAAAAPSSSAGAACRASGAASAGVNQPVELGAAAVAAAAAGPGRRSLPRRSGRRGGCGNGSCGPNIGRTLRQPGAVGAGLAAERLLDRRIDEDARHLGLLAARGFRSAMCCRRPDERVDVEPVRTHHVRSPTSPRARSAQSRRSGIGVSQISASRPIWCEAWPVIIGPPRGCAMSPTRRPGQPLICGTLLARAARGSRSARGWPQLRLRDRRITCQVSPSTGSAVAPATQPLA